MYLHSGVILVGIVAVCCGGCGDGKPAPADTRGASSRDADTSTQAPMATSLSAAPVPHPRANWKLTDWAAEVVRTHRANAISEIEEIARNPRIDPMSLADEIGATGNTDALTAFAQVADRLRRSRVLPAITAHAVGVDFPEARIALRALETKFMADDIAGASATAIPHREPVTAVELRALWWRACARVKHPNPPSDALAASDRDLQTLLKGAEAIGWSNMTARTCIQLAMNAKQEGVDAEVHRYSVMATEAAIDAAELEVLQASVQMLAGVMDKREITATDLALVAKLQTLMGTVLADRGDIAGDVALYVGNARLRARQYDLALAAFEHCAALARSNDDRRLLGLAIGNAAIVQELLDPSSSKRSIERALEVARSAGDQEAVCRGLLNLGLTYARSGTTDGRMRALSAYTESLQLGAKVDEDCKSAGKPSPRWIGGIKNAIAREIGELQAALGSHDAAEATFRSVIAEHETLGDRIEAARTRASLGRLLAARGNSVEAITLLRQARGELEAADDFTEVLGCDAGLAEAALRGGDTKTAIAISRSAMDAVDAEARAYGFGEAAGVRARYAFVYEFGVTTSIEAKSPADLFEFVERTRARAMRDGMASRGVLEGLLLDPSVSGALGRARDKALAASAAFREARVNGGRAASELDALRAASDESWAEYEAEVRRLQREAARASSFIRPQPATMTDVQQALREDEAVLVFEQARGVEHALVLRHSEARIVRLGSRDELGRLLAGLELHKPDGERRRPDTLRAFVLTPLALPDSVHTVHVVADDAVGLLPFCVLTQDVAFVHQPSASLWLSLRRDASSVQGKGVFAVGGPLRAGEEEPNWMVREASDLRATETLAHPRADVANVLHRLAGGPNGRWRAVHFACHTSVNSDRPAESALELTPTSTSDGKLRLLDVLQAKVDADLIVLAGCRTASGHPLRGEGVLSLGRAFMYAGCPTVIASSWDVRSDATHALMIALHAHLSAGDPPAVALREAQRVVMAEAKWADPYFWAGWVLMGSAR